MIRIVASVVGRVFVVVALFVLAYIAFDASLVSKSSALDAEIIMAQPDGDDFDFAAWRRLSEDIVGWIRVDGTNIDYPVLQAEDNQYYLSRNYRGEFATAGSVFLDYKNDVLADDFLIIYGHRMSYGKMFSDVTKFADAGYFDEHRGGMFYDENGAHALDVVSFAKISAEDEIYSLRVDAKQVMQDMAEHWREPSGRRYILLSTCDANNKALRNVLLLNY